MKSHLLRYSYSCCVFRSLHCVVLPDGGHFEGGGRVPLQSVLDQLADRLPLVRVQGLVLLELLQNPQVAALLLAAAGLQVRTLGPGGGGERERDIIRLLSTLC